MSANSTQREWPPAGRRLLRLLSGRLLLCLAAAPASAQITIKNQSCKGRRGDEVSDKTLEAAIEKFRKRETVQLSNLFICREALPTLEKHALDPDPRVREEIARALDEHYEPRALQALVRQLETYPTDKRPGREVTKTSGVSDPSSKIESGLVRRRGGDDAILRFASVYGEDIVGIGRGDDDDDRTFTDAEMERIYQRVTQSLDGGKCSTCRR